MQIHFRDAHGGQRVLAVLGVEVGKEPVGAGDAVGGGDVGGGGGREGEEVVGGGV